MSDGVKETAASKTARRLRKEIAKRTVEVEEGTLLRFRSRSRTAGLNYWYGAIFVVDRWWITSEANYFGKQKFSNDEFLDLVSRGTIFDVEVASGYISIK